MYRLNAQRQETPYRLASVWTVRVEKIRDGRDIIIWKGDPDFPRQNMRITSLIGHRRTPPVAPRGSEMLWPNGDRLEPVASQAADELLRGVSIEDTFDPDPVWWPCRGLDHGDRIAPGT